MGTRWPLVLASLCVVGLVVFALLDLGRTSAAMGAVFGIPLALLAAGACVTAAASAASRGTLVGWVVRGLAIGLVGLGALLFALVAADVGAYDTHSPLALLFEALVWAVYFTLIGATVGALAAFAYLTTFACVVWRRPAWRLHVPGIALALIGAGAGAAVLLSADEVFLGLVAATSVVAVVYSAVVPLPDDAHGAERANVGARPLPHDGTSAKKSRAS